MSIRFDTMCAAHLLDENLSVSLRNVAGMNLLVSNWGKGKMNFGHEDLPKLTPFFEDEHGNVGQGMSYYCARDTGYTHLLYESLAEDLVGDQELARLFKYLILPGLDALCDMERNGMWLDRAKVEAGKTAAEEAIVRAEALALSFVPESLRDTADLNKAVFLRKWIFADKPNGLGVVATKFTDTGLAKTDEAELKKIDHPAIKAIIDWRKKTKQIQFFDQWLAAMGPDDRIHPFFNPTGTVTGRRSCDSPNMMQVPRDPSLRGCVGAPKGWLFVEADYSQVEVRVAAWFAAESGLLEIYRTGGDVYRYTAAAIYEIEVSEVTKEQRQGAKAVVLGFMYGMGYRTFVEYALKTFGVVFTLEDAKSFRDRFFELYPGLTRWHNRMRKVAKDKQEVISPLGRVRRLIAVNSIVSYERGRAERQAINSPVQGFAGDMTLMSMIELRENLDSDKVLIVGDVHDALLFQVREEVWEETAIEIMQTMEHPKLLDFFEIEVPVELSVECKVGAAWGQGEEYTLQDGKLVSV